MAVFKVGQKLRYVRMAPGAPGNPTIPLGSEVVFAGYQFTAKGTVDRNGKKYSVDTDCLVTWNGDTYGDVSSCYEPIQYDGNQVIDWDACIWKPEHIRKKALAERLADETHAQLNQIRRSARL